MIYPYILFDLDGTLTESGEGIINSVLYALEKNGIRETDRGKLRAFVGPPLKESFERHYGFSEEKADRLVEDYREYFNARGWAENSVYPGIPGMLQKLRNEGRKLIVATSKPESASIRILSYFHLDGYFTLIAGASLDDCRTRKGDVIAYARTRMQASDGTGGPGGYLMVGDRAEDVLGAQENGIPCIGVLYGYGSREELEQAGAAALCLKTADLPAVIAALERQADGM